MVCYLVWKKLPHTGLEKLLGALSFVQQFQSTPSHNFTQGPSSSLMKRIPWTSQGEQISKYLAKCATMLTQQGSESFIFASSNVQKCLGIFVWRLGLFVSASSCTN